MQLQKYLLKVRNFLSKLSYKTKIYYKIPFFVYILVYRQTIVLRMIKIHKLKKKLDSNYFKQLNKLKET